MSGLEFSEAPGSRNGAFRKRKWVEGFRPSGGENQGEMRSTTTSGVSLMKTLALLFLLLLFAAPSAPGAEKYNFRKDVAFALDEI